MMTDLEATVVRALIADLSTGPGTAEALCDRVNGVCQTHVFRFHHRGGELLVDAEPVGWDTDGGRR